MMKKCQKINLQEPQRNRNATANFVNLIMTSTVKAAQNVTPTYKKYRCSSSDHNPTCVSCSLLLPKPYTIQVEISFEMSLGEGVILFTH